MTDSVRLSAPADYPTPAEDGTPAGHPTPAGEPVPAPIQTDIEDWLPDAAKPLGDRFNVMVSSTSSTRQKSAPRAGKTRESIGTLVLAWGALERMTAEKLMEMRKSFGDVRVIGGRSRPTLQRLLAELRALVAMRDRHDKQALTLIAALDADLQRIAQFRMLVVDGAQGIAGDVITCHDIKNVPHDVAVQDILDEARRIDEIRQQIEAL